MSRKIVQKSAGETRTYHLNDDGLVVERKIDVTDILEQNRKDRAEYTRGSMIGNTQRHFQKVASVPAEIYFRWTQQFGTPRQNPKKWKQLLNDADNHYMRTTEGSL